MIRATHQMAGGSQIAFAKAWLERRGIESQTVDVHSHIDSSLSYEENIKSLKQMLGMGGRSTKKATRNLSAAECDVAVGNYEAGFDHESTREACECGEPNACDDLERKKAKATPSTVKKAAKRPVSERIQKITNNMPAGYEIRKWYYEDQLGNRHTAHAVMFKGKAVFGQNKTFKSLTDARKALKEHISSERSREQNRKDREQFEKYGYIGERKSKTSATPPAPLAAATPNPLVMLGAGTVQAVTKPKRRTAAKKPARKRAAAKTTKAKPKAAPKPKPKKTAAKFKPKAKTTTHKLTAAQKKRLTANGRITVKRGGKFVTITK